MPILWFLNSTYHITCKSGKSEFLHDFLCKFSALWWETKIVDSTKVFLFKQSSLRTLTCLIFFFRFIFIGIHSIPLVLLTYSQIFPKFWFDNKNPPPPLLWKMNSVPLCKPDSLHCYTKQFAKEKKNYVFGCCPKTKFQSKMHFWSLHLIMQKNASALTNDVC